MSEMPNRVMDQLAKVRAELDELEISDAWRNRANISGSRILRSVADRIILSAKHLEALVKEETFSR
jgi:hypothetical protein